MSNKEFWNLVKPFPSNKGGLAENDIMLVTDEKFVTNELELSEVFNNHYVTREGWGVTTIYAGTGCAIFWAAFFEQKKRVLGNIFGKITSNHKFWGVILEK